MFKGDNSVKVILLTAGKGSAVNSFLPLVATFLCLLITFAKSLDPD